MLNRRRYRSYKPAPRRPRAGEVVYFIRAGDAIKIGRTTNLPGRRKALATASAVPLELLGVDTDPFGQLRAGLEGSRRIDRKDWGVSWNTPLDSGGVLVSDKITLEFELSLVKEALAEAEPEQRG